MMKKTNDTNFWDRLKTVRVNRAVYIAAIVLMLSLSVLFALTAINNRAKEKDAEKLPDLTDSRTQDENKDKEENPNDPKQPEDEKKDDVTPTVKEEEPPTLSLPVSGSLLQSHSVDIQVFSKTMNEYRTHVGIDIATAEAAPVCAAAEGVVAKIWEDPLMGYCVALEHTGEALTVYKNLDGDLATGISEGATVKAGQLLGYVGDSAILELAEEPHLHLEMTVKGITVDPMDYFGEEVANTLSQDTDFEPAK